MEYPVLHSFGYSLAFLFGIYFTGHNHSRNHPLTIKYRVVSVMLISFIIMLHVASFLYKPSHSPLNASSYSWERVFIRFDNLLESSTLAVTLTLVLYLGPIMDDLLSGQFGAVFHSHFWTTRVFSWCGFRNLIVAPVTEELIFRACIIFHLQPYFSSCTNLCLISPLFFSLAHFHHIYGQMLEGERFVDAFIKSLFQVCYTTVFGMYSAFLLLRTANVFAAIMAHVVCNFLGLPDILGAVERGKWRWGRRLGLVIVLSTHVLGIYLWSYLLFPLSKPTRWFPHHAVTCQW